MFNAIGIRHCLHLTSAKRCFSAQVRCLSFSAVPSVPRHRRSSPPAYIKREQQLVALQSRPELTVDDFEELAKRGEASIEQAEACLYQLKTRLSQLPLQERHEKCLQHNAGKRILLWYWNWLASHEPTPNRTLAHLVTWFLVPENRDDFIFRWIEREIEMNQSSLPEGLDNTAAMATLGRWAHFWLSGLATNHTEWSADRSPVKALQCFQRALQSFGQYASPQRPFVFVGLAVAIHQAVQESTHPPYDPTLWDSYHQNMPLFIKDALSLRQRQSFSLLYHPSRADGLAFYDFLVWMVRNKYLQVWSARVPTKDAFTWRVLRASYILRLQGHSDKARWLQDQAKLHNAWYFPRKSRLVLETCDLDPKLESLRQKASVSSPMDVK
ncbi:hypothetical protein AC578_6927 [Pseudocercospora eumusae]|uniref:Uncharacterized protein n=1 Tax=Pseudocercospora eumusae TaxID=321146 RepID=A0A139GYG0_9PEZI|nr:hypothetical protein AC578_6927 [Pseudocercospora eumusae]